MNSDGTGVLHFELDSMCKETLGARPKRSHCRDFVIFGADSSQTICLNRFLDTGEAAQLCMQRDSQCLCACLLSFAYSRARVCVFVRCACVCLFAYTPRYGCDDALDEASRCAVLMEVERFQQPNLIDVDVHLQELLAFELLKIARAIA